MMWIVLSATAILGLATIVLIPPWQSPDEPTHFEYAKVLAQGEYPWSPRPDFQLQERIIVSLDRYDYWRYVGVERPLPLPKIFRKGPFLSIAPTQIGKNPPLYYFIASLILRLSPFRSLETELYLLRIFSLFFTILTVALVGGCAAEVFGRSSPLVPAAAAAAAFIPQFLVIGTSVSPDPAINFCGAAVIYLTLKFQKTGFSLSRTIIILLCFGLGLLANYKILILLVALPGVVIIHLLFHRGNDLSPGRAVGWAGGVFLSLLVGYLALAWYYPSIARLFTARLNILCSTLVSFLRGQTVFPPRYWSWFNNELFKSFWLKYGHLQFELPPAVYLMLKIFSLISLLGLGLFLVRWVSARKIPRCREGELVITLLVFAALALGAYYLFWGLKGANTTTQGRHLFLVMPAWAILITLGWSSLFPARWDRSVGYGLLAAFFLLAVVSILFFILPTFS
ncbi:MAG: DUF2142 domain-containing protein [Candidatus Erginobacter occultus]|nr:DUF2142 domain-containing protein [Candidatus Erginobacter occultus]